ncbi:hypothetical protein [Nitrosophilus labii]|uniref:hypothetical protein n=1 Tax=Nitrosophilus labii TaxID=2706014 RepID=UPI0016575BEC|nr:hypothetical protein [Nitrosophilus labii]
MIFTIKNILAIKEANIKINGLTVIAGENDSGKSTVGKTLFALIKSLQMSKKGFFYKNRYIYITEKLMDSLKYTFKIIAKNKQEYDKTAKKINQLKKEIEDILNSKENETTKQKKYFNTIKKYKSQFAQNDIVDKIFEDFEFAMTLKFQEQFRKENLLRILKYLFANDYIKHNSTKGEIILEDKITGRIKGQVIIITLFDIKGGVRA